MNNCNCNNLTDNRRFPIIYSCFGATGPTGATGTYNKSFK